MHVHCAGRPSEHSELRDGMRIDTAEIEIYIDLLEWYKDGKRVYMSRSSAFLFNEQIGLRYIKVCRHHDQRDHPLPAPRGVSCAGGAPN